jgi:hypothetical protein
MLVVLADSNPVDSSCSWNLGRLGIRQVKRDGLAASCSANRLAVALGSLSQLLAFYLLYTHESLTGEQPD